MTNDSRFAARHDFGRALGIASMAMLLASCGGTSSPQVPPPNQAPAFTSASTVSFMENGTGTVYLATARDRENDIVTFKIAGGPDAARFMISDAGQLTFITPPNFDLPGDANGDNIFQVQLTASDGRKSTGLDLAVTVTNSKEGIFVQRVGSGFNHPVAIMPYDFSNMLVLEKDGSIYRLRHDNYSVFLIKVEDVDGLGALSIAPANNFILTGSFWVMYTTRDSLAVHRFDWITGTTHIGPSGGGPLMKAHAPNYTGGGWLGDSPGGLIIATGDAGDTAQDDDSKFGKIFRVTPKPDAVEGPTPEAYLISTIARGLHRPNGGFFYAGAFLFGDSSEDAAEEINYFETNSENSNFGWPFKEGRIPLVTRVPDGLIDPVIEYPYGEGLRAGGAIVGGAVVGNFVPPLSGQYVFADRRGTIYTVPATSIQQGHTLDSAKLERRTADFIPDVGTIDRPVAITADADGRIFIVDDDGDIFLVSME